MSILNISIISEPGYASPRVLSEVLKLFIEKNGHSAKTYYRSIALKRLFDSKTVGKNKVLWLLYRLKYLYLDNKLFESLKISDAVIICSTIPYAFLGNTYNIEKLKTKIKNKPIFYYGVRYIKDCPSQLEKLKSLNNASVEKFDWHLTVASAVSTEKNPVSPWTQIGLNLKCTGLRPNEKKEFIAIVDFERKGYEHYRQNQIQALNELGIPFISLEKSYTIKEIREIYKKAAIYFIQSSESFGVPIAECFSCGSYVFTPDSKWPMAWRLNEKAENNKPNSLPECFVVYNDRKDLKNKLITLRDNYNLEKTPKKVFDTFYKNYPRFYDGNRDALLDVFKRIEQNYFK